MLSAKYGPVFVSIMDKFVEIYAANSKDASPRRQKLIQIFAILTEITLVGGFTIYFLAAMVYLINPIYSYYFKNELVPIYPFYFPLFDENTISGYLALLAFHLTILVIAISGTGAVDFMFTAMFVNYLLLSYIFSDNVRELNEILNEKKLNSLLIRAKLKNILLMHRDIHE